MPLDSPRSSPDRLDVKSELDELGEDVTNELYRELSVAIQAIKNPDTRAVGWAALLTLIARLAMDKDEKPAPCAAPAAVASAPKAATQSDVPAGTPSEAPVIQAAEPAADDPDSEQALNSAGDEIPAEQEKGTVEGGELPYHCHQNPESIWTGGCPGYIDGQSQTRFDADLAAQQFNRLYSKGVRLVISLTRADEIAEAIGLSGAPLGYERYIVHNSGEELDEGNERLFARIGELISGNVPCYIHCRHGVHRAVIAAAGGWIASGRVATLGKAIEKAGGNIGNFLYSDGGVRYYAWPMLRQLIAYAKKKGVTVDPRYERLILSPKRHEGYARAGTQGPGRRQERAG